MIKKNSTSSFLSNFSLAVREELMRGNEELAILILSKEQKISQEKAVEKIKLYRENLKERKVILDLEVLKEQQQKELQDLMKKRIILSTRIGLLVFFLVILFHTFY